MRIRKTRFYKNGYTFVRYMYRGKWRVKSAHRLIAELYLGRDLRPGEVIHHINEIKSDNRWSNLQVMSSNSEHIKLHRTLPSYGVPKVIFSV